MQLVCNLNMCDAMQGECRVLLESSKLQHNTAINGGAFFAASTPCFMVSRYIMLTSLPMKSGWQGARG